MSAAPIYKLDVVPIPRLSLRQAEAAKALGISDKTLRDWTKAGLVPHVVEGGVTLYPIAALNAWLLERATSNNENARDG